jgi:hypothetical protein
MRVTNTTRWIAWLALMAWSCGGGATPLPSQVDGVTPVRDGEPMGFVRALTVAALERTLHDVRYDPTYRRIGYPGGDVPAHFGVCTDVVIRAYRALGVDLQQLVHEDMQAHFDSYPTRWGLSAPDANIDHRRVPNLEVFFARHGEKLAVTDDPEDYLPGDLVTWDVAGRPHIGIMVDRRSADSGRHLVVHNIGAGPRLEDMLFDWPITGHYRYYGSFTLGG